MEVLRGLVEFKANLYALWDRDGGASAKGVIVNQNYTGSTTTWGTERIVVSTGSTEAVADDIIEFEGKLVVGFGLGTDHVTRNSTDGTTWNTPTADVTTGLRVSVTANHDHSYLKFAVAGGHLVAVILDSAASAVTFFSTTDADTWTDRLTEIPGQTVAGTGEAGILGVASYLGIDDVLKIYVLLLDGLWEFDTSDWSVKKIFDMISSDSANAGFVKRMVVHNGELWWAGETGPNKPMELFKMNTANGYYDITSGMGFIGDGVPAELLGSVRWMVSSGETLFVSVGGEAASRNARVMAYTGQTSDDKPRWHTMVRNATANQKIGVIGLSERNNAVMRLHFGVLTSSSVTDSRFLEEPLAHPASGVSMSRAASCYIDLPYLGGGFPIDSKNWLRVGINAEDLSAANTGEYINVDYGSASDLGALEVRTANDLGDFLSGTSRISFGANSEGLSALSLGPRVILLHDDAGTKTDTPKLKDIQIDYDPRPAESDRWEVEINLEDSASILDRSVSLVKTDLNTAKATVTKVAQAYANETATYVKVESVTYLEKIVGYESGNVEDTNASLEGVARVVLVEVP